MGLETSNRAKKHIGDSYYSPDDPLKQSKTEDYSGCQLKDLIEGRNNPVSINDLIGSLKLMAGVPYYNSDFFEDKKQTEEEENIETLDKGSNLQIDRMSEQKSEQVLWKLNQNYPFSTSDFFSEAGSFESY